MNRLTLLLESITSNKSIPRLLFEARIEEGLKEWARNEIKLAGLYDKDSDYDGMLGKSLEELVDCFSSQGHSGGSASVVIEALTRLLNYQPLTSCDHYDNRDCSEMTPNNEPLLQCNRCYHMFSDDQGKTWYSVYDEKRGKK